MATKAIARLLVVTMFFTSCVTIRADVIFASDQRPLPPVSKTNFQSFKNLPTSFVNSNSSPASGIPSSNSLDFLMESPLSAVPVEEEPVIEEEVEEDAFLLAPFRIPQFPSRIDFGEPAPDDPDDPYYSTQGSWGQSYDDLWWHKRLNTTQAWSLSMGEGVTVAVLDTGIDATHEDLSETLWYNDAELNGLPGVDDDGNGYVDDISGWDFVDQDNDPRDVNGHGSHVAGLIAATANNQRGIVGIAPESKILPVQVLSASGNGSWSGLVDAIRYAADLGADVISMSLSGFLFVGSTVGRALLNAIQYARSKGSILVAAAGNAGTNLRNSYPATLDGVIAVGATTAFDNRASFSNYGSGLDFAAPGVNILSIRSNFSNFGYTFPLNSEYAIASGTSMATPIVSGVIALLKSQSPNATEEEILRRLRFSSEDLGFTGRDDYFGHGLVNPLEALSYDYYDSGEVKTRWIPGWNIRFDYSQEGSITKVTFKNGEFAVVNYWQGTTFLKQIDYYDSSGTLQDTSIHAEGTAAPLEPQFLDFLKNFGQPEQPSNSNPITEPSSSAPEAELVFERPGFRQEKKDFARQRKHALSDAPRKKHKVVEHKKIKAKQVDDEIEKHLQTPFYTAPEQTESLNCVNDADLNVDGIQPMSTYWEQTLRPSVCQAA